MAGGVYSSSCVLLLDRPLPSWSTAIQRQRLAGVNLYHAPDEARGVAIAGRRRAARLHQRDLDIASEARAGGADLEQRAAAARRSNRRRLAGAQDTPHRSVPGDVEVGARLLGRRVLDVVVRARRQIARLDGRGAPGGAVAPEVVPGCSRCGGDPGGGLGRAIGELESAARRLNDTGHAEWVARSSGPDADVYRIASGSTEHQSVALAHGGIGANRRGIAQLGWRGGAGGVTEER